MNLKLADRGLLDLDIRRIVSTRDELAALSEVKYLNASGNEITKIAGLQPLTSVQHINLCRNRLVSLSCLPLTVVTLDVSHNNLTTLEPLAPLEHLQNLDVSHNKLSSLEGLPRRSPLKIIKASYNLISSLQGLRAANPQTVRSLSLDSNYIKDPTDVRTLMPFVNLVALSLAGNPLCQRFPDYQTVLCETIPTLQSIDGLKAAALLLGQGQPQSVLPSEPPHATSGDAVVAAAVSSLVEKGTASRTARTPLEEHRLRELLETSRRLPLPKSQAPPPPPALMQQQQQQPARSPEKVLMSPSPAAPPQQQQQQPHAADRPVPEKVRRLEMQVEELKRLLDDCQERAVTLERENVRKGEEIRNSNRVITEQLKSLTEVREENEDLKKKFSVLKEKSEKLGREFKYAHHMNVTLRRQLTETYSDGTLQSPHRRMQDREALESAAALLSVPAPPSRRSSTPMSKGGPPYKDRSPTAPAGKNRRRSATPPQKSSVPFHGYSAIHSNSLLSGVPIQREQGRGARDSGAMAFGGFPSGNPAPPRSASAGGLGGGLDPRLQHVLSEPKRSSTPPVLARNPSPAATPLFSDNEMSTVSRTLSRSSPAKNGRPRVF